MPPFATSSMRRVAHTLDTQARYGRWQTAYRALKQRRPQMSDVWVRPAMHMRKLIATTPGISEADRAQLLVDATANVDRTLILLEHQQSTPRNFQNFDYLGDARDRLLDTSTTTPPAGAGGLARFSPRCGLQD